MAVGVLTAEEEVCMAKSTVRGGKVAVDETPEEVDEEDR